MQTTALSRHNIDISLQQYRSSPQNCQIYPFKQRNKQHFDGKNKNTTITESSGQKWK